MDSDRDLYDVVLYSIERFKPWASYWIHE